MSRRTWIREMAEPCQWARAAILSSWTDAPLPLLAKISSFLIMAAHVLLVMLQRCRLDLSSWRPGPGFDTIGACGTVTLLS